MITFTRINVNKSKKRAVEKQLLKIKHNKIIFSLFTLSNQKNKNPKVLDSLLKI